MRKLKGCYVNNSVTFAQWKYVYRISCLVEVHFYLFFFTLNQKSKKLFCLNNKRNTVFFFEKIKCLV